MAPTTTLRVRPTRNPKGAVAAAHRHPLRRIATIVAVLLGLVAPLAVAVTPAAAITVPPRTTYEISLANAVRTVINAERKLHGLAPVYMNLNLIHSARRHNVTMARYNTMSHQLPGEPYFGTRMTNAGYTWSWAGENIAWNSAMTTRGVVTLEKLMYNETPPNDYHRQNILNPHFRHVGVDVYLDKVHHKAWLTTDYGHH
ncbi:MAG: hypothetical protein QOG01_2173 [Pseudonocardiales bacterium]|jgi:uncharacterized protein YkwD|nr:hypothetical protein [Pseudonocardiales bacterium]